MIEYKFDVEITLGNLTFLCSGSVDYWIEDCSVGWVPFGDTQVWHPGDGDCVVIESLSIDEVTNEEGVCPIGEKRTQRLEQAVKDKLSDGDELIEYAKKRNARI